MLKLEVNTGMKASRGSILKACEFNWGCPKKTKAAALKWMLDYYAKTYGREFGAA
jgi:hypothetical protein